MLSRAATYARAAPYARAATYERAATYARAAMRGQLREGSYAGAATLKTLFLMKDYITLNFSQEQTDIDKNYAQPKKQSIKLLLG